jgi:selenocysteine-specific elongation factor
VERRVILGTAGHIDHGKTALVRALTGVDTDRLPEEKKRGITIDLGFAPLEIDGIGLVGIVDVPGHEAFVRTMVAGATGIDLALLVVAADEGVMPQTREHLQILSLLGIPRGVIALTKSDLVDPEWLSLVTEDVRGLVRGTPLAGSDIIPVSSVTGAGIDELKTAIARAAQSIDARAGDDLFRMPIDRAFSVKGTGTVVTGTVWSGSVSSESHVFIEPRGKRVRIRGIENHGVPVNTAKPGVRTAIALAGCEVADVERGMTVISSEDWMPTREIEVALSLSVPVTPRHRFRMHLGTSETTVRFAHAYESVDRIIARAILADPIVTRAGDRFVVRALSPAATVGGGEVIDPFPPKWKREFALRSPAPDPRQRLRRILSAGPMQLASIPVRTGLRPREVSQAVEEIDAVQTGGIVVSREFLDALSSRITSTIELEMANHPLQDGVSLEKLRRTIRAEPQVMNFLVDRLRSDGVIEVEGSVARPKGWQFRVGHEENALGDALLHEICLNPVEPPSIEELTARHGSRTGQLLRWMERQGSVERVSDDRYYGRDAVQVMVKALRTNMQHGRAYSPAELKDVLGVSRKYLIPFLEFCDRKGITRRTDRGRMVVHEAGD